jgi:hypothetical protein
MSIDVPVMAAWTGNLLVPAFVLWFAFWKPTSSRLNFAARLACTWGVVARLAAIDSFQAIGRWQQYTAWTLGSLAAICLGVLFTVRAVRLYRGRSMTTSKLDSNFSGRPT